MKTRDHVSNISYTKLSPNTNAPRKMDIKRITPHHVVGNLTIEATLNLDKMINYNPNNGCSVSYAIGSDGRLGLGVKETNRPWTSSSYTNDQQAITFEIANNTGAPDWGISDAAAECWMTTVTDICKFYGYKKLTYKVKPANVGLPLIKGKIDQAAVEAWIKTWEKDDEMIITLHEWFSQTNCPGPYIKRKLPEWVAEINKRLQSEDDTDINLEKANVFYKSDKEIAAEVWNGLWGNGQERIDKLINAGYDPKKIQKIVNDTNPTKTTVQDGFQEYGVKITANALNIRSGPGTTNSVIKTLVNDPNTYTIVAEAIDANNQKWGKLKSGIGWIALAYTKKV